MKQPVIEDEDVEESSDDIIRVYIAGGSIDMLKAGQMVDIKYVRLIPIKD